MRAYFCVLFSVSGICTRISSTLQDSRLHRSFNVAVDILRLCFSESNVPLLKEYFFIKTYVVMPFSFIVFHKGAYEIIEITSSVISIYIFSIAS